MSTNKFVRFAFMTMILVSVLAVTGCSRSNEPKVQVVAPIVENHVQVAVSIVINQNGYTPDWPAFAPNKIVVPANSLVTMTFTDADAGASALPKDSPLVNATGIVGAVTADGKSYSTLPSNQIAHTFTIEQLGLNVPFLATSGDATNKISFTFRTGDAGTYTYMCYAPCGSGKDNMEGPMIMSGYMQGTLVVQ